MDLALRQVLHEPGKPIATIYFPETGWTSMLACLEDGDAAEVGITVAAGALSKAGLIRYERGRIQVTDRPGLENASCECYGVVRRAFDTLIGQAGGSGPGGEYRR